MSKDEALRDLIERVERLNAPDQGMRFENAHHGERRYDTHTGKPYITRSAPATLTIYGERALTIMAVIDHCEEIAASLRAHMTQESPNGSQ